MLKIRLQRVGRVHEPSFRLVLTDSKNSTKSGRFKEILGYYDPRKSIDSLNAERIQYWLSKGASPTDTVNNLLVTHKVITASKVNVSAKSKKTQASADEEPVQDEAPVVEPPPATSAEATVPVAEGDIIKEKAEDKVA